MNSYKKLIHILVLIADLYLFRSPVGFTELILILISNLYLFRSPVGVTHTKKILVGTIELLLVRRYP